MPVRSKQFHYKTAIKWTAGKRGLATCEDDAKPTVEIATPPEFRGEPGYWTPEDLFVASINACLMTTFFAVAQREQLEFSSFECTAEGILSSTEVGKPMSFLQVILRPALTLPSDEDPDLALAVLDMAEQSCLISNSVNAEILLEPQIVLE